MEREENSPTLDVIERICKVLEVEPAAMLRRRKQQRSSVRGDATLCWRVLTNNCGVVNLSQARSVVTAFFIRARGESNFGKSRVPHTD